MTAENERNEMLIELPSDCPAYVSHTSVPRSELSALIGKVHAVSKATVGAVVPESR